MNRAHMAGAQELPSVQSTRPTPDHMNPFSFSCGVFTPAPRGPRYARCARYSGTRLLYRAVHPEQRRRRVSKGAVFSPLPSFRGLNSRRI